MSAPIAALSDNDYEIPALYHELLKKLFNGDIPDGLDIPTSTDTIQTFMGGVFEGFGQKLSGYDDVPHLQSVAHLPLVTYDTPDYHKLAALEKDVYQFSGAKNWQMLRDLTESLKDGDRVLSFKEWNNKAMTILDDYDGRYKKVEYDTAIASAQAASKTVDYAAHPDALVEYIDTEDERECAICAPYHGIILPWSDSFWRTAAPPNHFNCRCTTQRLNDGAATPKNEVPQTFENIPKAFRTNIPERGNIFPPNSPYYIGCPKEVLDEAMNLLPYERRFEPVAIHKNGGSLSIHKDYIPKPEDHVIIRTIAEEKAKEGHTVNILPELSYAKDPRRKIIFKDAKYGKSPDLLINGEYVEVKNIKSDKFRAVKTNIARAGNQADHVIINMNQKFSEKKIKEMLQRKFDDKPTLSLVELRYDGHYKLYPRADFEK